MTIQLTSAEILALPIEELELGVRAYNILKRMGIDTIEQFQDVSANDLNTWTRLSDIAPGLPAARQIADAQAEIARMLAREIGREEMNRARYGDGAWRIS